MFVPIVFQDEDLVVVNKPVGLNTHPSESNDPATTDVVSAVKHQLGLDYLGLHHRLDREVSGVLAFAARKQANANMAKVFEGRAVEKEYTAIVAGRLPRLEGEINAALTEAASGRYEVVRGTNDRRAQAARTRYRVEYTSPDDKLSLVRLWLETGRTHQLRVHLAYVGAPVVGDTIYGPAQKFPRLLLHAALLRFAHPGTDETVAFEAAAPPIFKRMQEGEALPEIELAQRLLSNARGLTILSTNDEAALNNLLDLAILRRTPFLADPKRETTGYCLINGASDGFPGLLVDCYNQTLRISLADSNLKPTQPTIKLLQELLAAKFPNFEIRTKVNVSQEAQNRRPEPVPAKASATNTNSVVQLRETGLDFKIQPDSFALELREMRERIRAWSKDHTVLNCFNPLADVGVVATKGGATNVLNLAGPEVLLDLGLENYRLNQLEPDPQNFKVGDVAKNMGDLARQQQKFDMVILNQPFPSESLNYPRLARLAGQLLAANGQLIGVSSDDQLERRKFRDQLVKGLQEAGRKVSDMSIYHEPELDFPRFEEVEGYLKVIVIKVN